MFVWGGHDVKYTVFGNTGLKVSRIAFGGMPLGAEHKAAQWDPFCEEGHCQGIRTLHEALDQGINYIDTAPSYGYGREDGFGNSECIIGKALQGRRQSVVLATKVGHDMDSAGTVESVEASLGRLRTDYVDVLQFHGGCYNAQQIRHILDEGPMEALQRLREQGKARFLGFTAEDGNSALDLIKSGFFDMVQVRYNIIYQGMSAAAIAEATKRGMGITVMRPMSSGQLFRILSSLEPRWLEIGDVYDVCLKFVLSDSRIHTANVGMRFVDEVRHNVEVVDAFEPRLDIAELPRTMLGFYQAEDSMLAASKE